MNASTPLRIAFVGAGAVNFGGGEGPWDHASRLERIDGLETVAVVDPDTARAARVIERRTHPMFRRARVFDTYQRMLVEARPDAVWIGVPPSAHGTTTPGRDIEMACVRAGVHMFIEKPLSAAPPDEVQPVADAIAQADIVVSVGYMFRYSRAIETMRTLMAEHGVEPRVFTGRYNCAYSEIAKHAWWDTRTSGGPVVEQLTHFVDLARYLCGEVDYTTLAVQRIDAASAAGRLSAMPRTATGAAMDAGVPDAFRIPRATTAVWRFRNGGVGCLTHGVLLHGRKYDAALELWGDGLLLQVLEPYGDAVVRVRAPHSEAYEDISCAGDDPYLSENRAFVEAVRTGNAGLVRSTYADALKTFALTCQM
jgi:predicted dehydrogenase